MRRPRWATFALVILMAALLLGAAYPAARRFAPPDHWAMLWDSVQACSGHGAPAALYARIVWLGGAVVTERGDTVAGEWRWPDTIQLTRAAESPAWVVGHELLHHLLQDSTGATTAAGTHPVAPFLFPCKLMPIQHQPGGIMAPRRIP